MHGIIGIAIITFRHCVRSRVVLLGVAAYVAVMALALPLTPKPQTAETEFTSQSGAAFDAERASFSPEGYRIRSIQGTSINAAIFLGFAITALVAATWLPAQIRGGELTFVLSKPIGRVTAVIGLLIGFWLVFLMLLAIYAVCGIGALRLAAWTSAEPREAARQLETVSTGAASGFQSSEGKSETGYATLASEAHRATWQFTGPRFSGRAPEGGEIHCRFVAEIAKADNEFVTHTDLLVSLVNPQTGGTLEQLRINNAKSGQVVEFAIPAQNIPTGDFSITVSPAINGYKVICHRNWLRVVTSISGFEWSYVKAFALAFIGLTIFVSLTVAGSTFLSANVSIFFSIGAGVMGACIGFFREYLQTIYATALGATALAGPEGRHVLFTHLRTGAEALGESVAVTITQTASQVFNNVIFNALPDWQRFNGADFIAGRRDIPAAEFGHSLIYAGIFCAVCIVVAAFAFGRRELK